MQYLILSHDRSHTSQSTTISPIIYKTVGMKLIKQLLAPHKLSSLHCPAIDKLAG